MIIEENDLLGRELHHKSSPKRLEERYRKKHFVANDQPLEDSVQKRLRRTAKRNKREADGITEEVQTLKDARATLNEIRSELFHTRPLPGSGSDGIGMSM